MVRGVPPIKRKLITTIALLALVNTSVAIAQTAGSRSPTAPPSTNSGQQFLPHRSATAGIVALAGHGIGRGVECPKDPCVYQKLKLGRSGDEVRPGWQVT